MFVFFRLVLLAVAAGLAAGALWSAFVPWPAKAAMVAMALLAWRRPADALVVAAGLVPIAALAGHLIGLHGQSGSIFISAVLGAHLVRTWRHDRPAWPHLAVPLLVGLIVASFAVEMWTEAARRPEWRSYLAGWWSGGFLHPNSTTVVLDTTLTWLIGIALYVVTWQVTRQTPERRVSLLWAVAAYGAAAAALNLVRVGEIAWSSGSVWDSLRRTFLEDLRVDIVFGDLNGAGSLFALTGFCALGLPYRTMSARVAALGMAALSFGALWATGSKAALVAVIALGVLMGLAAALRNRSWKTRLVAAAVVVVLIAGAALALRALPDRLGAAGLSAMRFRSGFLTTSVGMIRHAPVFGIGVGRYFENFPQYAPAWLRESYAFEHAHNNYLQMAAELGVIAMVLWLWIVLAALARPAGRDPTGNRPWGLTAGIAALLLTCLTGHPLLLPPIAMTFWLALGLSAGWPGAQVADAAPSSATSPARMRRWRVATIAAVVILAASIPIRAGFRRGELDVAHVAAGVSRWSPPESPPRTRTVGRRAWFHVAGDAATAEFDLRQDGAVQGAVVDVVFDGALVERVPLDAGIWHTVHLVVPDSRRRFHRVDLLVAGPDVPGRDGRVDAGVLMTRIRTTPRPAR